MDNGSQDFDWMYVGSGQLHGDRYQVFLGESQTLDVFETDEAVLTTGVCHRPNFFKEFISKAIGLWPS